MIPEEATTIDEFSQLASQVIDLIGDVGFHIEVYRSRTDAEWTEIIVVILESSERWRIECDGDLQAACELAEGVGCDLRE